MDVVSRLDEQDSSESFSVFVQRINNWWDSFYKNWSTSHLILCSHGDVLPLLLDLLCEESFSVKKAGWVELEAKEGGTGFRVKNYIIPPKDGG